MVADWSQVEAFLEQNHLGLLTTAIPLKGQSTIQASHLPFLFDPPTQAPTVSPSVSQGAGGTAKTSVDGIWNSSSSSSTTHNDGNADLGTLRCHIARANPQAKALLSLLSPPTPTPAPSSSSPPGNSEHDDEDEVLVVFSHPNNTGGYISPKWYTDTKPTTGKAVPTWNYTELQLYGKPTIISPAQIVRDLSDKHEHRLASLLSQFQADKKQTEEKIWKVEDAPEKYIELLQRAIIGLQIKITKISFKLKMSREQSGGDHHGVIEGLRSVGGEEEKQMADLVQKLGPMKP